MQFGRGGNEGGRRDVGWGGERGGVLKDQR